MNLSQHSQPQGLRCGADRCSQETLMHNAQVETPVETIAERRKVASGIFLEIERMIATRKTGLEIAENRVDPLDLRNILRLASSHHGRLMATAGLGDGAKTRQPVRENGTSRGQMVLRPSRNRLEGKARHRRQLGMPRPPLFTQRELGNQGELVLRTPSDLAATALATKVSLIHLDFSFKHIAFLTDGHHLQQLVVNQPSVGITHNQLRTLQLYCRGYFTEIQAHQMSPDDVHC